ncbi:MFS transporter [Streptomyces sp. NBC_00091]|uniref:MFS transporter n=1 Tax=Streptomyces sp. NBC_00091 TaxID=2975648 RepID=UPI0022506B1C|nr:MFS transporter [Streptomyces sp. NBC_00091]MCX5381211.1 MFS transporter [Streptomyces sp. NBC_00091]
MNIPSGGRARARWALVSVLAANMLVDALEVSATLVALPSVGSGLGLSVPRLQWLVSGFAAGFGGLLLLGGRLVERLGRRRVYLAALLVFAAASLAGALTDSALLLTATRVVKGFCVALTAPTGLAIILSAVPEGAERRRAVSVYSFFGAAGFCSGLLLSGLLTGIGWRWTIAFPAPVALLLLAAGLRLIPADGTAPRGPRPRLGRHPLVAGLALTGTVLLLVYALSSLAGPAGQRRSAAAALAGALLLGAVLVRAERTAPSPLLRTELLRHAPLLRSALGAAALNGSYVGFLLVAALDLRRAGWSSWETALAFLPASAPLALSALHSGRIAARLGPARAVAAGAAAAPLGYALYPSGGGGRVDYTDLLPAMSFVGVAFVLAFTALHLQATGTVPPALQTAAGGLYQTCVQLGAALTTALTSALYAAAGQGPALWLVTAVGLAGACVALGGLFHPSVPPDPPAPSAPPVRTAAGVSPSHTAAPTTDGRGHPSASTREAS